MSDSKLVQEILKSDHHTPDYLHDIIMDIISETELDISDLEQIAPICKMMITFYERVNHELQSWR